MRDWLQFMAFALGWSALAGQMIERTSVNPYAIFAVWIFGFVWFTGFIAGGKKDADNLTKAWLTTLAAISAPAAVLLGLAVLLS